MSSAAAAATPFEVIDGGRLGTAQRNEARLFALQIVRDEQFRTTLLLQARKGTLAPQTLSLLFHYAYGKPPDRLEVGVSADLSEMSEAQLLEKIETIKSALRGENKALTTEGAAAAEPVARAILTKKVTSLISGNE